MRHFPAELVRRKLHVRYVTLDDPENTGAFETEILPTHNTAWPRLWVSEMRGVTPLHALYC
jgi:hypothetical protein